MDALEVIFFSNNLCIYKLVSVIMGYTHWAKSPKQQSEGVLFFVNSAFKIQYQIVKNTLSQTAFSAILPTGYSII